MEITEKYFCDRCSNNLCSIRCDGRPECPDAADEAGCPTGLIIIEISSYFLKFRLHMISHAWSWSDVHRPTARRGESHNLYGNFGRF